MGLALRSLIPEPSQADSREHGPTERTASTSFLRVVDSSKERSCDLVDEVEDIIFHCFERFFPKDIVSKLGLVLVADGSFGRRMLVKGCSDIDLSFYATKSDFAELDEAEAILFSRAKEDFTAAITKLIKPLDLSVDELYRCRVASDLKEEVSKAESGKAADYKIARESVTKFCSSRALCGDLQAMQGFEAYHSEIWKEILSDNDLRNKAIRVLIKAGGDIVAGHSLYRTVQDVKGQPLTLATICGTLSFLLENEDNSPAIQALRGNLTDRSYVICAMREFLSRDAQILEPAIGNRVPKAIRKIYGEGTNLHCLAYKSSAWLAACFELLLEEAARQGSIAISGMDNETVLPESFPEKEQVKLIFSKSGNVALFLHHGLLQESFDQHLPEFADLDGVADCHDYQRLTLGRHSVEAVAHLDGFFRGRGDPRYVQLAAELNETDREALYFATALHDCGKIEELALRIRTSGLSVDPEYHADYGGRLAKVAAHRLGLADEQADTVEALVTNHLWFRHTKADLRDNMIKGTDAIPKELRTPKMLKMLALLTYADDASTDPDNWNSLRANHVFELCHAYTCLVEGKPIGLRLSDAGEYAEFLFAQHLGKLQDPNLAALKDHLALFPASYLGFPPETICTFFNMAKAADISGLDQVQIIPHSLFEFEKEDTFRYDILFVGSDKPLLASNLVQILAQQKLTVHSAGFAVNKDGMVFNQFTVTSTNDLSTGIEQISEELLAVSKVDQLRVPKVNSFNFDTNVGIVTATREAKAGQPVITEITLTAKDKPKLLLRFLVGLNRLGLDIVGADISTSTGVGGIPMAINRFLVTSSSDPLQPLDEKKLRKDLILEFRDRDESASGL